MDTTLRLSEGLAERVDAALDDATAGRWASRVWERDTTLWTDDPTVAEAIAGRLGWLDQPERSSDEVERLAAWAAEIEREGFRDAIVTGMGANSSVAEVLTLVFPESRDALHVHALDSTDPAAIVAYDETIEPATALRVIASKSGTTVETNALLAHQFAAEQERVGHLSRYKAGDAFVSITDPGPALTSLPHHDAFRETFFGPVDVGGRFGALSHIGLVPAALLRLDLADLLEDARLRAAACRTDDRDNDALVLGVAMAALARAGRDKLTLVIEPELAPLGAWIEALVAESTGKDGKGIVPIDGEPLGPPGVYGDDRAFVRLGPADADTWLASTDAALDPLLAAGHPLIDIRLDDESWIGGEFFRWQFATAIAGAGLGIDPFDEPNVAEAKAATAEMLRLADAGGLPAADALAERGPLRLFGPADAVDDGADGGDIVGLLRRHIEAVTEAGYLHLGAWFAPSEERSERLRAMATRLRDGTRHATLFGYGPAFVHTTGQLHKGGPPSGVFVHLVAGHPIDVDAPGHDRTFGTLIDAQALADVGVLAEHGRPVVRIHLGDDVDAGLEALAGLIEEALTTPAGTDPDATPAGG